MEQANDVLTCGIYDASIIVDGDKVPQYGVKFEESEEGPQATCWIPSTAGKTFSIHLLKNAEANVFYTLQVFLDEHRCTNTFVRTPEITVSMIQISDSEARGFVFATLDLTDDDAYLEAPSKQNIGTIKLVVQLAQQTGQSRFTPSFSAIPDPGKIHERSKKGLTHCVNYGPVTKVLPPGTSYTVLKLGKPTTMLFKYRPLEILQATGVAPRIRSQSEEEDLKPEIIDPESDNDEEEEAKERELLAQLEASQAQLEALRNKKRAKQGNGPAWKKVKREPARHFVPGEVIDLTL